MLFSTLKPGGGGPWRDWRGYRTNAPGLFVLTRAYGPLIISRRRVNNSDAVLTVTGTAGRFTRGPLG